MPWPSDHLHPCPPNQGVIGVGVASLEASGMGIQSLGYVLRAFFSCMDFYYPLYLCAYTYQQSPSVLPSFAGFCDIPKTRFGNLWRPCALIGLALPLSFPHIILPFLGIHWNPCCSLWTPDKGNFLTYGRKKIIVQVQNYWVQENPECGVCRVRVY